MIDVKRIFGNNLKALRGESNLTQEAFSETIKLAPTTLSLIESGKAFTTAESINAICNSLTIPPSALFELDSHYIKTDYTLRKEAVDDINLMLINLDDSKLKLAAEIIQMLSDNNLDFKYRNLGK